MTVAFTAVSTPASLASPITSPFIPFASEVLTDPSPLRAAISNAYRCEESEAVARVLAQIVTTPASQQAAQNLARSLVSAVREIRTHSSGVDALMQEYALSSNEGIALMCLAEALLRIPDRQTADRLIADKLGNANWHRHLGASASLFVNAATWGLLITGKVVAADTTQDWASAAARLVAKGGAPVIRAGVDLAMRMLGKQFVVGQTIEQVLANSRSREVQGYRYSYDMLGEAALTAADAAHYQASYEAALHAIGQSANGLGIAQGPGISVKLSALHPRYARAQRAQVMRDLLPRLTTLMLLAKRYHIGLNIDAEEADRLELSLDLLEAVVFDPALAGFDGIGFVVQAYQKRSPFVIDYLIDLARRSGHKLMVRLVKGAYWDTEIKRAQVDGLPGYAVYTRKVYTDVSYLACAQKMLAAADVIYPQFATHNAQTLATLHCWATQAGVTDFEFQCLHGMGETLYDQVVGADHLQRTCRIYAPVGAHHTLLPYLVRRLLENGANSSFVNQLVDPGVAMETLIADPIAHARLLGGAPHPQIALPVNMFGNVRRNSTGIDFSDEAQLRLIAPRLTTLGQVQWQARPLIAGASYAVRDSLESSARPICNPADRRDVVGWVIAADSADVERAFSEANRYAQEWESVAPDKRAAILLRAADLFEADCLTLMSLAVREAGKSLPNAIAEVREAVDFLRYYATQIGGVSSSKALGPVVCISPWNFPLAIFIGQVSAALAAGNVVLAKPAEQTPLMAFHAIQLLHAAGVPVAACQLLPGEGAVVGAALVADARICGVVFTGSTEVAQLIHRTLTQRAIAMGQEPVLIAETGGQNAMIVDASALPEQVVQDVMISAFDSAGQRCSALRVLCLQEDIADQTLSMLEGAMQQIRIGNPDALSVDCGPVIDRDAQQGLEAYIERITPSARRIVRLPLPSSAVYGTFVAPTLIEITNLAQLQHEVFGPVLHVVRFKRDALPALLEAINATGYGLTLGIHSRIDSTIDAISAHAAVGNIYVNRTMVGAVVGVQPFGGEGKSGTGPKAGGPLYLHRLQREAVVTPQSLGVADPMRPRTENAVLTALIAWCDSQGHHAVAQLAAVYARVALTCLTLDLPGPTGERNTLRFAPRGRILCAAISLEGLLNQLLAVLSTGNAACLLASDFDAFAPALPLPICQALRRIGSSEPVSMLLIEAGYDPQLKQSMAARDGALIQTLDTDAQKPIACWRLIVERAMCVNTTAAGGNASLMTMSE